ncbi:MAG: hypothetical protein AB1757_14835 [Acidobacteriota bacterium]
MIRHRILASLILFFLLIGTACIKRITVPETLPTNEPVEVAELVNRINAFNQIDTLAAQGGIKVTNYFTDKENKADELPGGDQLIRFKKPENILLKVKAPIIGKQVADMATDGKKFSLAIFYPGSKRQFIYGTNPKQFKKMTAKDLTDPRLKEAGGLVNMRPQHITDAFKMLPFDQGFDLFREEVTQEEPDTRPGRKGKRVYRNYYVLYLIERKNGGTTNMAVLRRKFWFDRTISNTPLTRVQVFENDGELASDIYYLEWFKVENSDKMCPGRIVVDRRDDGYKLELTFEKDSTEINGEIPDKAFELQNLEKLPETNLDEPRKPQPASPKKNSKP